MSKTQNPGNLISDLTAAVKILTHSSSLFQNALAVKMDLTVTEAECISYLMDMGSAAAGDLAKVTRLTTGAITNLIDRLENAGYIKREKDPHDRRKVIVVFLPEKHKKVLKCHESISDDVSSLFSAYSKKELKMLLSYTTEINAIYDKRTEEIAHR